MLTQPHAIADVRYSSDSRPSAPRTLWRYRELLRSLIVRDLKVKYQRSALGLVWTLLNPTITLVVLISVFSYVIRLQLANYWAFLISGFFVWTFIQQSLHHAASILKDHATLSRSVAFPREVLIVSALAAKLTEYLVEIAFVLVVIFAFHHQGIPPSVVLLPYFVLLQVLIAAGLMLPLSVISVMFYDVQHALPPVIMTMFYLSPVFYPVSMIPEAARPFYYLNPFAGLLRLFHVVLYEGGWPSLRLIAAVSVVAVGIFLIGYSIFSRFKDDCVEIA